MGGGVFGFWIVIFENLDCGCGTVYPYVCDPPLVYGLVGVWWGSNPVENASNRGKTDSDCIVLAGLNPYRKGVYAQWS